MELMLATIGMAGLSMFSTAAITRKYLTPCSWYWFGWILGTICAELSGLARLLPPISPLGQDLIVRTHIGAAIGFLIGSVVGRQLSGRRKSVPEISIISGIRRLPRGIKLLVASEAFVGMLLLGQRLWDVGLGGIVELSNIRQSFLEEAYLQVELPPLLRLYSFVALFATIAPALLAQIDATNKRISYRMLFWIFFASVPGGISTGGRVWVITVPAFYTFSYLTTLDSRINWSRIVKVSRALLVPALFLTLIFAGIGLIRDSVYYGDVFQGDISESLIIKASAPVYVYLGITVVAAGPYSEYATQYGSGYGKYSFPSFASQLERLGILESPSYAEFVMGSRAYVTSKKDRLLGSTHASIIPSLIADFGLDNLLESSAILMCMLQMMYLIFYRKTLGGHMLATVICLYGGAFAFQDSLIGTSNAVIPIIAALAYDLWLNRRIRHNDNSHVVSSRSVGARP